MRQKCNIPDCGKPRQARGMCTPHYYQWRRTDDAKRVFGECSVDGCSELTVSLGLCTMHYLRHRRDGDVGEAQRRRAIAGMGFLTSDGYRVVYRKGHPNADVNGQIKEHTLVMSEMIGRALFPDETVHHRNGIRDDNRPENLELRASHHPRGQTPEDLLEWAHEIIERYGGIYDRQTERANDEHLVA